MFTGELFEMVMEEMRFPEVARQAFSLWLVSDNLGEFWLYENHQISKTLVSNICLTKICQMRRWFSNYSKEYVVV